MTNEKFDPTQWVERVPLLLPNGERAHAVVNGDCCWETCEHMDRSQIEDRCALFGFRTNHGRCIPCHEAAACHQGYEMAKKDGTVKKQITVEIDVIRHDERRCGSCVYQGWDCNENPWCRLFDSELAQKPFHVYLRCRECLDKAVDVEDEA